MISYLDDMISHLDDMISYLDEMISHLDEMILYHLPHVLGRPMSSGALECFGNSLFLLANKN